MVWCGGVGVSVVLVSVVLVSVVLVSVVVSVGGGVGGGECRWCWSRGGGGTPTVNRRGASTTKKYCP